MVSQDLSVQFVLLILIFMVIGQMYLFFLILTYLRIRRIIRDNRNVVGKLFYYLKFVLCLFRIMSSVVIVYFMIAGDKKTQNHLFQKIMTITICLVLLWENFVLTYMSIIDIRRDTINQPIPLRSKSKRTFFGVILVYFLTSLIVLILFNYNVLKDQDLFVQSFAYNFSIALIYLIASLYLNCSFSGQPFISAVHKKQLYFLRHGFLIWGVGRFLAGLSDLILYLFFNKNLYLIFVSEDADNYNMVQFVLQVFYLFVYLFISEIWPVYKTCDYAYMNIFKIEDKQASLLIEQQDFNFHISDFDINFSQSNSHPKALGNLHKGTCRLDNTPVLVRKVDIPSGQINTFQQQDLTKEVRESISQECRSLIPILLIQFEPEFFLIITRQYESLEKSLKDYRNYESKVELGLKIARAVKVIGGQGLAHGHISPGNVFLGEQVWIGDYGFPTLKKIASVHQNYSNKTCYSAPEILADRGSIVKRAKLEHDIYSIGFILWAIMEGEIPFQDMPLNQIVQSIVQEQFRPKIKNKVLSPQIINIIQACWQADPKNRPLIHTVVQVLENELNSLL